MSNLLPSKIKQYMAENDIQFYIINAYRLTQEVGIPGKVGICMLAAFLKLTNLLPMEKAFEALKREVLLNYEQKSEA
ncbi:2-oxoacid:acceptor oxidoreductase family protein, partial [Streptococcus suis]|uniref:2-oxoacid:acceptor oxidoreductase family protein n=1 Tax=Streptococcus suis TaxID=1307 RepID=UPI001EE73A6B